MLEEVAAEGVTGAAAGFVAAGYPRAAHEQVVALVEGRRGEVVINRVHVEAVEGVGRRVGPLPDIAGDIEEVAVTEARDRAGRGVVIEEQTCNRKRVTIPACSPLHHVRVAHCMSSRR